MMKDGVRPPSPQVPARRRRFWAQACIAAVAEGGFTVELDGRGIRLPGGAALVVQSEALASAIAGEWAAAGGEKGGHFTPDDLPMTRIAGTMIERVAPDPMAQVAALLQYVDGELLCYRADYPAQLCARQHELWDPQLAWLRARHGIDMTVTTGIMPLVQAEGVHAAWRTLVAAQDNATLAALGVMVPAMKSIVLGLAVVTGALSAAKAADIATVDERTQMDIWGHDAKQVELLAALAAEVADADRFVQLCHEAK
ncbi:ATP12 family chaperone protein [Komagataeibacter medellinensis]|uniref:ATP synthase F1 mitochondrial assembly chaperone n=1 Tax=Komagataeibacter medellinensis (strain NBRC 3288 / BCRC 11682 / LMG 1693 / Kondo 51) TaxID=634177 RepID=G2I1W2_KOMMN|nr:ATP12 family protein [Komagataeibacter medellinensis]BAK84898.1 ATP synthase F1 mitochondrial assembly chaperone [Komagataeibacter medellinensis NBRC 3288]